MGNCTGFCMTSTPDEQTNKKVRTAEVVKSALHEKDELFKEAYNYEESFNQNGG